MSNKVVPQQLSSGLCCLSFTRIGLCISCKMISDNKYILNFSLEGSMDKKSIWTNSIGWLAIIGCKGATSGIAFLLKQFWHLLTYKVACLCMPGQ